MNRICYNLYRDTVLKEFFVTDSNDTLYLAFPLVSFELVANPYTKASTYLQSTYSITLIETFDSKESLLLYIKKLALIEEFKQ